MPTPFLRCGADIVAIPLIAILSCMRGTHGTITWDASLDIDQINTLGIWINRGGFGGFHHVALEPTNGGPDALDVAVRDWQRFGRLNPGERRQWSFCIRLSVER